MTITDYVTRKAGRPRSAQSHQAILKATIELLAEEGIGSMSIEAVAARGGR
jgi:AcrR family transcriptional regulator